MHEVALMSIKWAIPKLTCVKGHHLLLQSSAPPPSTNY